MRKRMKLRVVATTVAHEKDTLDNDIEESGFVVANSQDHSFSMISYKHGPSDGYHLHKPDLIPINRNLWHFLNKRNLQPCWNHVDAILEVSTSASCQSMVTKILEKTVLMFKAQAFRWFAISLAIRGTSTKNFFEYCFLLVDRSGVCLTGWNNCTGYDAIGLVHIVFALFYTKPELLGIKTSMTTDLLTGNITKIKVQPFKTRSLMSWSTFTTLLFVLFGRGTHILLYDPRMENFTSSRCLASCRPQNFQSHCPLKNQWHSWKGF